MFRAALRAGALAALVLLAACAESAWDTTRWDATRWHAILVAPDGSLPVWDNAVARFAGSLVEPASVRRFSVAVPGAEPGTLDEVIRGIGNLRPGPGEGCLVFVTAHGAPGAGLVFPASRAALSPRLLDSALNRGCGAAPTVVIASGCYTGDFAGPPLARPNRVVLTAARADRPSFGCGAGFTYTVFDSCLLDALDDQARSGWGAVADAAASCVTREEARLRERPSEPRRAIPAVLRDAPIPWRPDPRRPAA